MGGRGQRPKEETRSKCEGKRPPFDSGNSEPNIYLYKHPSNLVPVILTAYNNYEDGADRALRNVDI